LLPGRIDAAQYVFWEAVLSPKDKNACRKHGDSAKTVRKQVTRFSHWKYIKYDQSSRYFGYLVPLCLQMTEMPVETIMTVQKLPRNHKQSSDIASTWKLIHCPGHFVVWKGKYSPIYVLGRFFPSKWQKCS
jgi:hypothetical protein